MIKNNDIFFDINPRFEDQLTKISVSSPRLIVVSEDMSKDNDSRSTLMSIIKAMNLNAKEEVTFLFIDNLDMRLKSYDVLSNGCLTIIFGISPKTLGLNIIEQKYQLFKLENSQIIYCDAISELNKNKQLKVKLWNILQEIMRN
ncbi:MAG TPA: hypothetical protein P5235_00635 [Saprospiraceae bacterium]|nr:hypothetical protein [Saprospiraceae bacterium]MCB9327801.1 hypothetical protein [Lewinellaceae bacterium]HPK10725.1 hypothetical protein [Saprospiraceae bacterium]HRX27861.1 hypothetical protein [Saprospiraceae bacterium]